VNHRGSVRGNKSAAWQRARRDAGLCPRCGRRPPLAGITSCASCALRFRTLHRERLADKPWAKRGDGHQPRYSDEELARLAELER